MQISYGLSSVQIRYAYNNNSFERVFRNLVQKLKCVESPRWAPPRSRVAFDAAHVVDRAENETAILIAFISYL